MSPFGLEYPVVFRLGRLTRLRLRGGDVRRYLQGQLSNRLPEEGRANRALVLTAKGKLCAMVFVFAMPGGDFVLETEWGLRENFLERMGRYVVADDVEIEDISREENGWHILGAPEGMCFAAGFPVERLGEVGWDVAEIPREGCVWRLASGAEVEWIRICRGIPAWGRELDENTLPQEAGLERWAVDFHKGCYVGQEVVSRIQSVGRVNRRLRGFVGEFPLVAGQRVLDAEEKVVGELRSVSRHLAGGEREGSVGLGYLSTRSDGEVFSIAEEGGKIVGFGRLYEFPLV